MHSATHVAFAEHEVIHMRKHASFAAAALSLTAATAALTACDGLIPGGGAEGLKLPPVEALFVPKPSDGKSSTSTATQAVCADGTDAIADLEARVDGLNNVQQGNLALLKALQDAAPVQTANVTELDVESGGKSLHVQLVQAAGQVALTGTDADGAELISGTYAEDGDQGALTLLADDGTEIDSVWSVEGDGLKFVRDAGEVEAVLNVSGSEVQLVVQDAAAQLAAHWDRDTGAGSIVVDNGTAECWSEGTSAAEMCDVDCGAP
jgi:hypothetical protein